MLTRNVTSVKDIPGEPGQTMTFRQLGWRQLGEAREALAGVALRSIKQMGGDTWAEIQRAQANRPAVEEAAVVETAVNPMAQYDRATILLYGIVAWSYPEKLNGENIGTLDEETAKWAATEIINMGKPPVEKEVEEDFFGSRSSSMASPATQTVAVSAMLGTTPNGSSG